MGDAAGSAGARRFVSGSGCSPHRAGVLRRTIPSGRGRIEGDVLVKTGGGGAPLKATDLPPGGPQIFAWPMDPADKTVRDGTRLNKVLLLRLDPAGFDPATLARAADGVVAYSAICPHTGCEVMKWQPETQRLECPCHFSQYDPKAGARWSAGLRRAPCRRCR